jgi:dienelactone hydrolase
MGTRGQRAATAIVWACASTALYAETLTVTPARALADEVVSIRAAGLDPGERVTLRAELTDGMDHRWSAQADFLADSSGVVDVSKQPPVGGSYKEISAMGLVWSMMPADRHSELYQPPRNLAAQVVNFQLLRKGQLGASARLEQLALADGVRPLHVEENGLRGVLFLPAPTGGAPGRRPGVLVVGGSNGGLPSRPAAWLASHGYVALALAYFRYQDLPARLEAIPLEYFGRALEWMARRPEINPDKLAVSGTSRGGELALQLGSMFSRIRAVVAYVPANVRFPACCGFTSVPYAWTWEGRPLAFLPVRAAGRADLAMRAEIVVENTRGPILTISGGDDHVWHSASMADSVMDRLKRHHFQFDCENLKYPHAGHSAGRPDFQPAWHGHPKQAVSGRAMDLGGSPRADAESSLDAIPKVLDFLGRSLQ